MRECDRNICNIDVPETEQAIKAIKTIKEFCNRNVEGGIPCRECPVYGWCQLSRAHGREIFPYIWQIPQLRGEQHE